MQVLSLHPLTPNGLNLMLALIGTPIQVHHHILSPTNTGFTLIYLTSSLLNLQTTQLSTLLVLGQLSFNQ